MRRRIRIENATRYRTDDLRRFVVRAAADALGDDTRALVVRFKYTTGKGVHGRAYIGGYSVAMRLPRGGVSGITLAFVLTHEFGHTRGLRHAQMRSTSWRWPRTEAGREAWRAHFGWGDTIPVRERPVREAVKATGAALIEQKRAALEVRRVRWQTKAKRAATALRTIARQMRYYDRRAAAVRAEGGSGD